MKFPFRNYNYQSSRNFYFKKTGNGAGLFIINYIAFLFFSHNYIAVFLKNETGKYIIYSDIYKMFYFRYIFIYLSYYSWAKQTPLIYCLNKVFCYLRPRNVSRRIEPDLNRRRRDSGPQHSRIPRKKLPDN